MNCRSVRNLLFGSMVLGLSAGANAGLHPSYQFIGNGNWSLDAVGSNNTPVGLVDVTLPAGSKIEKAFLYCTRTPWVDQAIIPVIDFDGSVYSGAAWTDLGVNGAGLGLKAWRTDVTKQVATTIGGGGGTFSFSVNSEDNNTDTDGEVLAVVYSNPLEAKRTVAFLDGFSSSTGDGFSFFAGAPMPDVTNPSFEALMSLGIGYGYQAPNDTGQYSKVWVNGGPLTTSAGGQDDGQSYNGGLVTVGGLGDSPINPPPFALPNGDPRFDDELYTLTPFIRTGDLVIGFRTLNPSQDDNIFFAGINITAEGSVSTPDAGASALLTGLGLLGLLSCQRRNR